MSAVKNVVEKYGLVVNINAVELSALLDPYIKKFIGIKVRRECRQVREQFEQLKMIYDFLPEGDNLH